MSKFLSLLLLVCLFTLTFSFDSREEMVSYINKANTTFTATVHAKYADKPMDYVKNLCGAWLGKDKLDEKPITPLSDIPDTFDSRTNWPKCPTIQEVRDQSKCGSCWAFATVEAGSDRICIQSNGADNFRLSATDLLSCCGFMCGQGCNGGNPSAAWKWFTTTGSVTGGDYGDESLCKAYSFPQCDHHTTGQYDPCDNGQPDYNTPKCVRSCDANSTYGTDYSDDKHKFKTAYSVSSSVEAIQTEIMTNGPVGAAFSVYADFEAYSSGVYQHTTGQYLGGHAVKIIGWGVDGTNDYWLVANSWNTDWGEDGFFRILRGSDECGIESEITAGSYN